MIKKGIDWSDKTWWFTGGWLAILAIYITVRGRWCDFITMDLNELGDFLAGSASPLAVLWFVRAYMLQQHEIAQSAEEIRKQSKFQGMQSFLGLLPLVQSDIQFLALRVTERVRENTMNDAIRNKVKESRSAYFGDDKEAPLRRLIMFFGSEAGELKLALKKDQGSDQDVNKFIAEILEKYSDLVREADAVDSQDLTLRKYIESSVYGKLYNGLVLLSGGVPSMKTRKPANTLSELSI